VTGSEPHHQECAADGRRHDVGQPVLTIGWGKSLREVCRRGMNQSIVFSDAKVERPAARRSDPTSTIGADDPVAGLAAISVKHA